MFILRISTVDSKTVYIFFIKSRVWQRKNEKVILSTWKAYQIKGKMDAQFPELFDDDRVHEEHLSLRASLGSPQANENCGRVSALPEPPIMP
jgi:hypothetical protein